MLLDLFLAFALQGIGRTKACEFNPKDILTYELSYLKGAALIEVNAPDTRLVSCKPWSDFPYLLVVEVDLGSGASDLHETELFIYDTLSKDLREIFRKKIRESTIVKNPKKGATETIKWETPYKLEKTRSGKPGIRWTKSSELVNLE
jgi:hypothetical protein